MSGSSRLGCVGGTVGAWRSPPGLRKRGSLLIDAAPLLEQLLVGMVSREGKAAVGPPEVVVFLAVDEGGIPPALLSAFHLEVVEEPGEHAPFLGLRATWWPGFVHVG